MKLVTLFVYKSPKSPNTKTSPVQHEFHSHIFHWTQVGKLSLGVMLPSLAIMGVACALGALITFYLLPSLTPMFIHAQLFGHDLSKVQGRQIRTPESMGVITGCVFLVLTIVLIPVSFSDYFSLAHKAAFPHAELVKVLAALLSIACMLLLGFADDVLDLRWRHKLLLPSLASLPLLMVYYVLFDGTVIVVPVILRPLLGANIDLGLLYYLYMGLLAVFCTNAINILAGINGLEVGQSIVMAASILVFNVGEMDGSLGHYHRFSMYFLLPYLATSLPLLFYNWYPASMFVGDTFCYYSGMTLAVVAILGHFSKTLLLFFMPQIFNFLYSVPQLFHMVPCPRHRLPAFNAETDRVQMSLSVFKQQDLRFWGRWILYVFRMARVIHYREFVKEEEVWVECNNMTLINLVLRICGPMHEQTLTIVLLVFQVFCSVLAFFIRYPLAYLFYGEIIA
ncbi:hypothetical protein TCAL_09186 [Tigriopus californicus]|uniref:UDP-N-acetylglucosamine--dolichyl-phosphate N-acetylglucosaminephosphotransferase n=1 Tax=Tigriopus californicus TaxID=6832 RepID=A0A553PAJ9_TIGCA|nr:UDP-N-acetylglucosamine--dolichyl-phosphate N-acetylglucosaminephosphotransferase-like [Tigriopus californicus]TRY74710.1 hypothetical protein TCAL_09186 [Tigriopus californicus]